MRVLASPNCSPCVHLGGPHAKKTRSQILWCTAGAPQEFVGILMTGRIRWAFTRAESTWTSPLFSPTEIGLYTPDITSHTSRVSLTLSEADRLSGRLAQPEMSSSHRSSLETAIERSQNYLLGVQKPEGYWVGELMVDSTLVSDTIAYHHWNGKVDLEWQRKAVNHIFSMQLPDGGWNIYHGGPAEVNATIKAYLALKLAGTP